MIKVTRKEMKLREQALERGKLRASEQYFTMKQWQLVKARFFRNRLAVFGSIVLAVIYFIAIFCGFLAPYGVNTTRENLRHLPPMKIHIYHEEKLRFPFVYGLIEGYHPETYKQIYVENKEELNPFEFFVRGEPYKIIGLIPGNIHLFGTKSDSVHLFGTDSMGRDLFSRCFVGAQISCTVGFIGVVISFVIGLILGGLSGYIGGILDTVIQRIIDFITSLPTLPLWMALAAAVPANWPILRVYFTIVVILSLVGWTGLARVVRSKFISLKNEEFVKAARIAGTSTIRIIMVHMVPMFASHLIASLTLSVPGMILGETSLSFLGIGLRPPAVSWGVLLADAQTIRNVALYPWILFPCVFIIITVMCFNFLGDGLRDAADPYA
jgi:peptide/nickel transport system permease protein